jgi:hypothetical protein
MKGDEMSHALGRMPRAPMLKKKSPLFRLFGLRNTPFVCSRVGYVLHITPLRSLESEASYLEQYTRFNNNK